MTSSSFTVHDVSTFPIVRLRGEWATIPGSASSWCAEMECLVGRGGPFVLIYPARQTDEPHEDRVARGLWLKRNKQLLADRCLALVVVEPDPDRRAALDAAFPSLVRAFGVPQAARACDAEALDLARHLLAGGTL